MVRGPADPARGARRPRAGILQFLLHDAAQDRGEAGGFCAATETTGRVLAERRRTFLLDLEQRLRLLAEPQDILVVAAEALGRYLGAGQVAYSDIDDKVEVGVIEHEWNDGTIPSNAGVHRIEDFGPGFAADLRAGRTIVIEDVRTDPRTCVPAALAAVLHGPGMRAGPCCRDG